MADYDWRDIEARRLEGQTWPEIAPDYDTTPGTIRKAYSRYRQDLEENGTPDHMRVLGIDIETAPNTAYVWGMFKQNISPKQLLKTGRVMCFSARWYSDPAAPVIFVSENKQGHEQMVQAAWDLLDQADAVVHYNGARFDIPTLQREFLKYGMTPPSTYKQIDLLKTARKEFRFTSNKLEHLLDDLGLGAKGTHEGFTLWVKCMDPLHPGHEEAWKVMEEYNRKDVTEMEKLYRAMLPWISNHPNHALYQYTDRPTCPNCGGTHLTKQGFAHTKTQTYQQYKCDGPSGCGRWLRERYTQIDADKRNHILTQAI